jgi:hypothetical protein
MTKQGMTKLFAVVALVGGCELAEAEQVKAPTQPKPTDVVAKPTPTPADPKPTPTPAKPGMSAAVPRTLPNGRPANGNCTGRCSPAMEQR